MDNKDFEKIKDLDPKERLLKVGELLIAENGYEKTTVRMIAEAANVNIAMISFYFGDKENFYYEVMNTVAEEMLKIYEPFANKVREIRESGMMTPVRAWDLIEEYFDLITGIVRYYDKRRLYLLIREEYNPPKGEYPITRVLCKFSEAILDELLVDYWGKDDMETAVVVARTATSSIIAYGEHPMFIKHALEIDDSYDLDDPCFDEVFDTVKLVVLTGIRMFRP